MNKKPKRLILGYIQNNKCNLRCDYCYYTQREIWKENQAQEADFPFPPAHIAKALSPKRLGGISLINFTAQGETLLCKGIVEVTKALLQDGHYVEIVTNGTIKKRIFEILEFDDSLLARLEFKISFHYRELLRLGQLNGFFSTIDAIKNRKCSFALELVPSDKEAELRDDIYNICMEKLGAPCQLTIARDDSHNRDFLTSANLSSYCDMWKKFDSPMFEFKIKIMNKKRREFCYAGNWALYVNMTTGEAAPCYGQPSNQNIFKNVAKKIHFFPVGHYCTEPYCINGHAHLAMGVIPNLQTPTFAEMRNRKASDGTEFFNPSCKEFFSQKLYDTNKPYSKISKAFHSLVYPLLVIMWTLRSPRESWKKLKRGIVFSRRKIS